MNKVIARPEDDYSKDWDAYWKQNPGIHRGVGADAVDGGDDGGSDDLGDDGGSDELDDGGSDSVSIDQYNLLKSQLESLQTEKEKLSANNKSLLSEKTNAQKIAKQKEREVLEKTGTVEEVKRVLEEESKARDDASNKKISSLSNIIKTGELKRQAAEIANKIARDGYAQALMPHIEQRLSSNLIEGDDGDFQPEVTFLSQSGSEFYGDRDQFIKDISNTDYLMQMIKGPQANGSGNPASATRRAKIITRAEYDANPEEGARKLSEGYQFE